MNKSKPKIVIIGAGSLYFGRQIVWAVNRLQGFRGATLSLVDTDVTHLEKIVSLARLAAETSCSGVTVEGSLNFRDALPGADFVVLSFSERNAYYRRMDCEISAKYGIRMCSGDTIGPGGVFRTMREFPHILEIAHTMEELCPNAWLINYINPSAVNGIGLMRHAPRVKSFALCDSHHMPYKKESYLKMLGIDIAKMGELDMRIAGVNHFTWMLKANLGGRDILPDIREAFRSRAVGEKDSGYAKGRFNNYITAQLADVFGAVPTLTGHTKEYVPYYQGHAAIREAIPPISVFDTDERDERTIAMWEEVDDYATGRKPMSEFFEKGKPDHAADIIHTMITEDNRTYFINRTNSDAVGGGQPVGNLPADAFLEMECKLDRNGPRPLPVMDFPLGLRALQMQILDVHELTIEAIVKKSRSLLVRALAMDPLVNSIATARSVIEELFRAEKEALPGWPEEEVVKTTPSLTAGASPQLY